MSTALRIDAAAVKSKPLAQLAQTTHNNSNDSSNSNDSNNNNSIVANSNRNRNRKSKIQMQIEIAADATKKSHKRKTKNDNKRQRQRQRQRQQLQQITNVSCKSAKNKPQQQQQQQQRAASTRTSRRTKMEWHLGPLFIILIMAAKCGNGSGMPQNQHQHESNSQLDPDPEFIGFINNVTYPAGREAVLACSVRNLGKNKVGWLRASDQTVLALQGRVVTHNARISVMHQDMHTWKLKISKLRESDRGCYMCQINTSPMKKQVGCIDVQVPPDIINEESSADLAVQEGEDATLTCKATGNPQPRVIWRREDGEMILIRKPGSRELMKVETYNGSSLRLLRLERRQMGAYLCIASNDVPPAVSKRVSLSVQFAPMVRAPSQLLGTPLGSDVQLECQVEASPSPVSYWLKGARTSNGFASVSTASLESGSPGPEMLLDGPKYGITEKRDGYRGVMLLVVRSFSASDVGTYHCVSTNSLGRAEGTLRLYEIKLHPGASSSNDEQLNYIPGPEEAPRNVAASRRAATWQLMLVLLPLWLLPWDA